MDFFNIFLTQYKNHKKNHKKQMYNKKQGQINFPDKNNSFHE